MEYLSSIDRSSYIIADYIKNGEKGELVPQVIAEKMMVRSMENCNRLKTLRNTQKGG